MARGRVTIEAAPVAISAQIAELQRLPVEALQARWRAVFARKPPPRLPRHLLLRVLAYQLQAQAQGDLSRQAVRHLERLGREGVDPLEVKRDPAPTTTLRPGTQLVREHAGIVHQVMVVDAGFAWRGATYMSLSDVARAITGTRWNGPRFFGLRAPTS